MAVFVSNETGGGDWDGVGTWVGPLRKPQAGDTVTIKAGDTITLTQGNACDAVTDIEATGTLDLSTFNLDVGGGLTLNGTISGSGDLDFEALTYVAGTNTNTGTWTHTASGNVSWNAANNEIASLVIAGGVTTTLTGTTYVRKFTATGDLVGGANFLFVWGPDAAGWWTQTGDVASNVFVMMETGNDYAPGDDIVLTNKDLTIFTADAVATLTMDASISLGTGTLTVRGGDNGQQITLDMAGFSITAQTISLGDTDSTGIGILDFGYNVNHAIGAGGILATAGGTGVSELDFASSTVVVTGGDINLTRIEATGDGMTVTSDNLNLKPGATQLVNGGLVG